MKTIIYSPSKRIMLRASLIVSAFFGMQMMAHAAETSPSATPSAESKAGQISQGHYLAIAADCMACHTVQNGKDYAGGYAIESPLGTIYSTNITPSKTHGIGNYTEAQFANAIRGGIRGDGSHLYPAMPYTSYAKLTDSDVQSLYDYFMHEVKPVDDEPAHTTSLPFPFNIRLSMMFWNTLFLDNKPFTPDGSQSDQINRGAYLVEGLAHCSACHTPRNVLMAEEGSNALSGSPLGSWYAPNVTPDPVSGIGGWSDAELAQYLKTGHVAGKAQAAGPMAEAITNSFQHLTDADISAMIAYLHTVKPVRDASQSQPSYSYGQNTTNSDEAVLRGMDKQTADDSLNTGAKLFSGNCASCHQPNGAGSENQAYPSLFHNTVTGSNNPSNLISAILFGVDRTVNDKEVLMPRFDEHSYVSPLSNEQVALISNYVLKQYGNPDVQVTPDDVAQIRHGGKPPFLARVQPYMLPAMVIVGIIILLAIILIVIKRKRR